MRWQTNRFAVICSFENGIDLSISTHATPYNSSDPNRRSQADVGLEPYGDIHEFLSPSLLPFQTQHKLTSRVQGEHFKPTLLTMH